IISGLPTTRRSAFGAPGMSLRSTSPMSKCAISIRPAVPIAAFTTASRSADVRAAATALANSDMSGWPMAAASLETTAAKGCAEITVARSTSTRRMAMRSIALTFHLTIVWSHDRRRASTCLNDRDVYDVFGDEPYLKFVASDDPAYDQIVRAIIPSFSRPACHRAGLLQHDLVRVQQARDLDWHFLPALRRPRNKRRLCDIVRHRNAHAAEQLNALGHGVDHLVLLVIVLIEGEMELIERGAGNLAVMFLVQVAKRHRVGQQLIEIVNALFARVFRQGNRHSDQVAERLDLVRVLPGDGRGTLQNRVSIECRLGHGGSSLSFCCGQRPGILAPAMPAPHNPTALPPLCL